ncbi:hypothetical protein F3I16_00890 [Pseudomonas sp. L-22-4S-12]|uniref:intermembrane phospholipid transport protein YdbH family protein n=1 Tax=Pseudomonas sp. L-22-4S-12 TaxID=2610893 RepID=UPI00132601F3|nr:YdbH domain-containing protein [Pseudomonas sp. L-22-4S-12]MWV14585.1 hypothetical protein [Pseudomonas sp. L-22-4S-12]
MPSRHKGRRLLGKLLLALLLLAALLWLAWRWLLAAQGISQLDWQGLQLSGSGLQVDSLLLVRDGADGSRLQVSASALQLAWPQRLQQRLYLPELRSQALQLSWQAGQGESAAASNPQASLDNLAWLPRQLAVDQLSLELPCATGRCALLGSLQLQHGGALQQPAELRLQLQTGARSLEVQAHLEQREGQWQLRADAQLDRQPLLTLRSELREEAAVSHWQGELELELADSRGLFVWLQQWQTTDQRLLDTQASLRLQASWQLALAPGASLLDRQRLRGGSGTFSAALQLHSPLLQYQNLRAEGLALALKLDAKLAGQQLQISLLPSSSLQAKRMQLAEGLRVQQLQAKLAGLSLQLGASPSLSGPLQLSVSKLEQAELLPQAWQFDGQLQASAQQMRLQGALSNAAGLNLSVDGERDAQGALKLSATLAELFFRAGNPLSQTFRAWPALLQIGNGRLLGQASLQLPLGAPLLLDLTLQFQGLAGIYDRSELTGLDGELKGQLRGDQLSLELPQLNLQQLNPGLSIGPLQLQGRYVAGLGQPLQGQLSWQTAQAALLQGQAWLPAGQLDLGQPSQRLHLQFEDVQLEEIFRVYPAEGLAGRGSLRGELPLLLDAAGLRIEQGRMAAQAPGYLQFRSEKIRALGRSNPGMQLVVEALDDFHFDLLDSAVSYAADGKLQLALRLQGRNPAVEQGRPINLNVNLEEDIPALLTSLQLTDRVSETIRQRVQQRLRQRNDPQKEN